MCWCSISDCIFAPTHSFPSVSRAGSCQSSSFGSLFKDNDTLMGCPARHEQEQDTCQRKTWGETVCVCVGVHVRVLVYVFVCNLYPFWNKKKKAENGIWKTTRFWIVCIFSILLDSYSLVTALIRTHRTLPKDHSQTSYNLYWTRYFFHTCFKCRVYWCSYILHGENTNFTISTLQICPHCKNTIAATTTTTTSYHV